MKKVFTVGLLGSILFVLAKFYKKLSWHKRYIDEVWSEVADVNKSDLRQDNEIDRIDQEMYHHWEMIDENRNDILQLTEKFDKLEDRFEEAVTNGRACCSTVWLGQLEDRFEQLEEEFETFKRFRT